MDQSSPVTSGVLTVALPGEATPFVARGYVKPTCEDEEGA